MTHICLEICQESVEFSFFKLAFEIIDNAGFTSNLQKDFLRAVSERDHQGYINWRLIRELNERSYTKAILWTKKNLEDSCTSRSISRPSPKTLSEIRKKVNEICDKRKRELDIGRRRQDYRDVINKHQYALDQWKAMYDTIDKLMNQRKVELNNSSCTIL